MNSDKFYVHVGVTGHRFVHEAVQQKLRAVLRGVLQEIGTTAAEVYESRRRFFESIDGGTGVKLRIISSLAEGVDQIVAREALSEGYELQVPMPFNQRKYENTFEQGPASVQAFRDLLEQATAVLCTDFEEMESSRAYEDASRIMLCHSDLLIAVWDGKPNKYIAGTYSTIREAIRQNIPIIYVSSDNPETIAYVQNSHERTDWQVAIREYITRIMLPTDDIKNEPIYLSGIPFPQHEKSTHPDKHYNVNDLLESFILKGVRLSEMQEPFYSPRSAINMEKVNQHKALGKKLWGDMKKKYSYLSSIYSGAFRNSVLLRCLLPITALLLLIGATNTDGVIEMVLYFLQILMLVFVIWLVKREKAAHTNRCFYGYRSMAERSRISLFLSVIGYCNVNHSSSSYMEGKTRSEGAWFYRILQRSRGIPDITLGTEETRAWLYWLRKEFLYSQLQYHHKRKERSMVLQRRLGKMALFAFYAGLLATVLRACADSIDAGAVLRWAGALALFLPTLATFFTSYTGTFGHALHYAASSAMVSKLWALMKDVDALLGEYEDGEKKIIHSKMGIGPLFSLSDHLVECCLEELSDWEDSIQSRMLKLI